MKNKIQLNDCPECGKKKGAHMGSSEWGHNVYCCSDECGFKIAKKIKHNIDSKEYKELVQEFHKISNQQCRVEDEMRKIKYKNIE